MIKCRLREGGDPHGTEEKWGPGLAWQTNPSIPPFDWMRGLVVVPVTSTAHKQTVHSQSRGLVGVRKVLESIPTPHPSLRWDTELQGKSSGGKVTVACKILPWRENNLDCVCGAVFGNQNDSLVWLGVLPLLQKKKKAKIWGWNLDYIRVPSNPSHSMSLLILLASLNGYNFTQDWFCPREQEGKLVPDGKENNCRIKKIIYSDSYVENFGTFGRCLLNFFLPIYFLELHSGCVASRLTLGIWDSFYWLTHSSTHSNVLYLIMYLMLSVAMILGFHLVTKMETELSSCWSTLVSEKLCWFALAVKYSTAVGGINAFFW